MTRQIPDQLEAEHRRYRLSDCLPILPPGHPRWELCGFLPGRTTANYRGYTASWGIREGRLFLDRFGGTVADDAITASNRFADDEGPGRPIGMIEVHETVSPVPATWVTRDLCCEAWENRAEHPNGYAIPSQFRLFRIKRGDVLADVTISNERGVLDIGDREVQAHLDASGVRVPRLRGPTPGLEAALTAPVGAEVSGLLWQAAVPDCDLLLSHFARTTDSHRRRWIACALGRIGPAAAPAVPMLSLALEQAEERQLVRALAYGLAGIGGAAACHFALVVARVEAVCGAERNNQVALMTERLGAAGARAIGPLIDGLMTARGSGTQHTIAHALGRIGSAALPPLLTALRRTDSDAQRAVLSLALNGIGPEAGAALGALVEALEATRDDGARVAFADALKAIGLRSAASLPPLQRALRASRAPWALRSIVGAMMSLGSAAVDALVLEFERTGDPIQRIALAQGLGELGAVAGEAVESLFAAARETEDAALLGALAEALRRIGAPDDRLAAVQIAAVKAAPRSYGADPILERIASGAVPPPAAIEDLAGLLIRYGEGPAGRQVAKLLGAMGAPAVAPLLKALSVPDEARRLLVIHALGLIGAPSAAALDTIVEALAQAREDRARLQVLDDMRRIGCPDARHLDTLLAVMERASFPPLRWRLGLVLATFGAPAVAPLVALLERSESDDGRRAIGNALCEIGAEAVSAAPTLLAAMQAATDPRTREILAVALRRTSMRLA